MYKQDAIGELLYIGFVAEKGRCYGRIWNFGYKKTLKIHVNILFDLANSLFEARTDVNNIIAEFVGICDNHSEIGKFYNISKEMKAMIKHGKISWEEGCSYHKINQLMLFLLEDLLKKLDNFMIKKEDIYHIFNILHNLPRVYLGEKKETICKLNQVNISEEEALNYAFQNMDIIFREKYNQLMQ